MCRQPSVIQVEDRRGEFSGIKHQRFYVSQSFKESRNTTKKRVDEAEGDDKKGGRGTRRERWTLKEGHGRFHSRRQEKTPWSARVQTGREHTQTCSRWRWPRPSSAGFLCPCCTPPRAPRLLRSSPPHLRRGSWLRRGRSGWTRSRSPVSACCGDSSKSQRDKETNDDKHTLHRRMSLISISIYLDM